MDAAECPICRTKATADTWLWNCPRCGHWNIVLPTYPHLGANSLHEHFGTDARTAEHRRSRLSHLVRLRQRHSYVNVPLGDLQLWALDDPLPTPSEQIDRMVLWVGGRLGSYVESVEVQRSELAAWIGAPLGQPSNPDAPLNWLLNQDRTKELLDDRDSSNGVLRLRPTLPGWEKYETLRRTVTETRTAFMAMDFKKADVQLALKDCFKPAVERAGFELRILTEGQAAGLIDDQMRVALRGARFVISDLSHGNLGAYWEAGFAEGMGRPVIYTCRSDVWEAKQSHFDTNHLVTVIWDRKNLADAGRRLTATVRATLPEAKMAD
jgi:hypothetical protein